MSFMTYSSYLRLDELLETQTRVSEPPEHDEMLFIVVHQVYELWFKQMLHEGDRLGNAFEGDDLPLVLHTLRRMCTILKTLVAQVDVIETMTPLSFSSFRHHLQSSSGFQSQQFRQLEMFLGKRNGDVLRQYAEGTPAHRMLVKRMASPSLYDLFLRYLSKRGHPVPQGHIKRDFTTALQPSAEVQAILLDIYHNHPDLAGVCERLVDLDEGFQEWRYRHVQMVLRTIGGKMGTGGSAGVNYLRGTLFQPFFPDLWQVRQSM